MILAMTGCATKPEIRYIQPKCSAPPLPELPTVDAGELWDRIGQQDYDTLMQREKLLSDWALEMKTMIGVLCDEH